MLHVGFCTDKGMLRSVNEDAVFVMPTQQLYIVADGVGGHNAGDVASRLAVQTIASYADSHPLAGDEDAAALKDYFMRCFSAANEAVFTLAVQPGSSFGMATTCVSCYIQSNRAFVVNVGDSRAYLIRGGHMVQITEDHSRVQELLNAGRITPQEAQNRPDRNMITRAVGGEPAVLPDFFSFTVYPEDVLLLCSDGLYGEVQEERIAELCTKHKAMHSLAKLLVDEANKNGGRDNISAVCIRVQ